MISRDVKGLFTLDCRVIIIIFCLLLNILTILVLFCFGANTFCSYVAIRFHGGEKKKKPGSEMYNLSFSFSPSHLRVCPFLFLLLSFLVLFNLFVCLPTHLIYLLFYLCLLINLAPPPPHPPPPLFAPLNVTFIFLLSPSFLSSKAGHLFINLFICLATYPYIYLFTYCLYIYHLIYLPLSPPPLYLSIFLSISLSISLSLSSYLPSYLPSTGISLLIYLSVTTTYPFICLYY